MISNQVDSHIHYKHSASEVETLSKAILPLRDDIVSVSSGNERGNMRKILNGNYFRRKDALAMKNMLLRAAKHGKASLGDYFPMMRETRLGEIQALEDAVTGYWTEFCHAATEIVPAH